MSNLCDRILRLSGRAGGVLGLAHGSREGLSGGWWFVMPPGERVDDVFPLSSIWPKPEERKKKETRCESTGFTK